MKPITKVKIERLKKSFACNISVTVTTVADESMSWLRVLLSWCCLAKVDLEQPHIQTGHNPQKHKHHKPTQLTLRISHLTHEKTLAGKRSKPPRDVESKPN